MSDQRLILLVEDREDDIALVRKAFDQALLTNPLKVLRDGEEAIAYLAGEGQYADRREHPLPWLVLLDLKMPRVDGFEVLKWIRGHAELKSLVVIVLTVSDQVRDVNRAYALGANSFMVKPSDFENAVRMTRVIHEHWLHFGRVPPPEAGAQPEARAE